jgi:hypothetical protein
VVHHNVQKFVGMDRKSHYLIWMRHKTSFIALHRSGVVQTWCMITGFKTFEDELENKDLKKWLKTYKLYKRDARDETY